MPRVCQNLRGASGNGILCYMTPLASLWACWVLSALFPLGAAYSVRNMHPVTLAWVIAVSGFAWFLPGIIRKNSMREFFRWELIPSLFMVGFCGSAMTALMFSTALQYTTPANAGILAQVEVVYSLLLSRIFLREKLTGVKITGAVLVISGTLLVALKERFSPRWTGDLLVLCAPWLYQISHVYAKKLPKQLTPDFIAAARMLYSALSLTPIAACLWLLRRGAADYNPAVPPQTLIAAVLTGLLLSGLSALLWYRAIRSMELSKATVIILSYPVLTFLVSAGTGMEKVHLYQLGGLACALLGAYLVSGAVKEAAHAQ